MPPTNTPAPATKASPEPERRDAQAEFREWLESKAPDHDWPQPITAIVAHAAEFFGCRPAAIPTRNLYIGGREPGWIYVYDTKGRQYLHPDVTWHRFCGKAGFFRSRHDADVAIAKSAATDRREPGEGSE